MEATCHPPARGCLPNGRRGALESRSLIFISADYCGHQSSGKISATKSMKVSWCVLRGHESAGYAPSAATRYKFLTICVLRGRYD